MKYVSKIMLLLVLCADVAVSCKDDDGVRIPGGIAVDKEEVVIGAEGGIEKISVSSHGSWMTSSSQPWIAISPANGLGSAECSLAIDSTLENTVRTAQIRFSLDNQEPKIVTVTQFGFGKQIILKEPDVEIENSAIRDKRYFEATISTNINFRIAEIIDYSFAEEVKEEDEPEVESERKDWLTLPKDDELEVNLDRKARPRTIKVRFHWGMNTTPYTRVARIHLIPADANDQLVDNDGNPIKDVILTVTQKPALRIEDNRSGDSLAIITINEKIQSMMGFDTSENMRNWGNVKLWEATDEDDGLPAPEAIGRVRSVTFMMFDLQEGDSLPKEIRHLKYLESLVIQSNANRQIRDLKLGEEICELKNLKNLTVYAYGIKDLPTSFKKLGGKVDADYAGLEALSLAANNFSSLAEIMKVVNEDNFPKLTALSLVGNRRTDVLSDLTRASAGNYNGKPIGLNIDIASPGKEKEAFCQLMAWDNLRELGLGYNFIEGSLPTDAEMADWLRSHGKEPYYTETDFFTAQDLENTPAIYLEKLSKDTCEWLLSEKEIMYNNVPVAGNTIPRVLPNARLFSVNLNFLTGNLPNWVLFHPYFVSWGPEVLIFNQQEKGKDSNGNPVLFDNVDYAKFDYSYYYGKENPDNPTEILGGAYPLYYRKYVAK